MLYYCVRPVHLDHFHHNTVLLTLCSCSHPVHLAYRKHNTAPLILYYYSGSALPDDFHYCYYSLTFPTPGSCSRPIPIARCYRSTVPSAPGCCSHPARPDCLRYSTISPNGCSYLHPIDSSGGCYYISVLSKPYYLSRPSLVVGYFCNSILPVPDSCSHPALSVYFHNNTASLALCSCSHPMFLEN